MLPYFKYKIPPTGAKYVFNYHSTYKQQVINSYSDNYLKEILTHYILKSDRYNIILVQHNNRPITVVIRKYEYTPRCIITDYIQIITDGDTPMTKDEIREYIRKNKYLMVGDV